MYCNDSFYDEYVLDNGAVLQKYPQIDGFNGTPAVADFGTGKYSRRIIFDTTNPCTYYYLDGGSVKSCTIPTASSSSPLVTAKNGVPTSSDFGNSDFIFDSSSPCDLYYLDGSDVKKCNPTVIAYTGTPPASAFSGGAEFIRDRSSPCDVYYLDAGTVTKCSTGSGSSSSSSSYYGVRVNYKGNYQDNTETVEGATTENLTHRTNNTTDGQNFKITATSDCTVDLVKPDMFSTNETITVNLTAGAVKTVNFSDLTTANVDITAYAPAPLTYSL